MSTLLEIRRARTGDAPAIRACAEAAYRPYVAAIGKKPAPMVADFPGLIDAGVAHVAVDAQGKVLGFVVFYPQGDHVLLENVAVHPVAAGRGIGKQLVGFCEAEAKRRGANSVRLYTNEKMIENLLIYPHLGYVETERKREDGFNRVYFEKRI